MEPNGENPPETPEEKRMRVEQCNTARDTYQGLEWATGRETLRATLAQLSYC
jgi:hypothetical protein